MAMGAKLLTALAVTLCMAVPLASAKTGADAGASGGAAGAAPTADDGAGATAPFCQGRDLIAALPADQRAALAAAVRDVPYHQGRFWQAERDGARITIIGTYHFPDARHAATLARFVPALADADALLVEAGPDEQARLTRALADDPTLMMDPTGPTLPERLPEPVWDDLAAAMQARGMPPFMVSRMRPWYVSMMLGIAPCAMRQIQAEGTDSGLDGRLVAAAQAAGVPIRALEPWDTLFTLFADLTPDQQIAMMQAALASAVNADDFAVTLAEAYFRGQIWTIWEFGIQDAYRHSGLDRAEVDEQAALAKARMMDARNADWIEPLEQAALAAAGRDKGVVAAFGALHLPGEAGVLNLLAARGWRVTALDADRP